jgi:hypothetical protein
MKDVLDDNGNKIGFQLESPAELAAFNELCDFAKEHFAKTRARAQKVFDAYERGKNEAVDIDDKSGAADEAMFRWQDEVDSAIREHLDVTTLGSFIQIVLQAGERAAQAARAGALHAENRSMKAEVFSWLDEHMTSFKSMDAAADAISSKGWPIKWRTARDWVGQWKKLRSAGTP